MTGRKRLPNEGPATGPGRLSRDLHHRRVWCTSTLGTKGPDTRHVRLLHRDHTPTGSVRLPIKRMTPGPREPQPGRCSPGLSGPSFSPPPTPLPPLHPGLGYDTTPQGRSPVLRPLDGDRPRAKTDSPCHRGGRGGSSIGGRRGPEKLSAISRNRRPRTKPVGTRNLLRRTRNPKDGPDGPPQNGPVRGPVYWNRFRTRDPSPMSPVLRGSQGPPRPRTGSSPPWSEP